MYRVSIELYKHEWKFGRTRNAAGTRAVDDRKPGERTSIETRSTCFLFLMENTETRNKKTTVNLNYQM